MIKAINLTHFRRYNQNLYNIKNNITPKTIISTIKNINITNSKKSKINKKDIEKQIKLLEFQMNIASENTDFEQAAMLRDEIIELRKNRS